MNPGWFIKTNLSDKQQETQEYDLDQTSEFSLSLGDKSSQVDT